eukprot:11931092-Ditylum_brightwellii.AAC.1
MMMWSSTALCFSTTRCSQFCGINKKQWGSNNDKMDNNSQDYNTYIMSAVGGKSFVMGMNQSRKT